MKKRIRIQIIGNDIERIIYSLNRAGIYTENLLQGGNPLGFVSLDGDSEETFPCTITEIDNIVSQLPIKKNLDAFLSHDSSKFCSNKIKNGIGKSVRYRNTSSYVLVYNTNLVSPLLSYKGRVYANTGSRILSEYLRQNGAEEINPCLMFAALKNHFDRYIDILLNEYGREHIILVKAHPSPWYIEGGMLKPFDVKIQGLRELVSEIDRYFIYRTGCIIVDTFAGAVPEGLAKTTLPCVMFPRFVIDELAADIINTIYSIEDKQVASSSKVMGDSHSKQKLYGCEECLKKEEDFIQLLLRISREYTSLTGEDLRDVMQYAEQGILNLSGLLGIYLLAKQIPDRDILNEMARCILYNKNCIAVNRSIARYEKNRLFLESYPNFRGNILKIEDNHNIFLKVSNRYILALSAEQGEPFRLILFENKQIADEQQVIAGGYCCDIHEAEALCGSIKFYVQRAKDGKGNEPVELQYESQEVFLQSLFILDYSYLLQNEPFLIGVKRSEVSKVIARTDLSFLFQKSTRCVRITGGLADQIAEYVMGTCIQRTGGCVYYDDLLLRSVNAPHLGYELDKVLRENIDNKCLCYILSDSLLKNFDGKEYSLPDVLFESGVDCLIGVAGSDLQYRRFKKAPVIKYKPNVENLVSWLLAFEPLLAWYDWYPFWNEMLQVFQILPYQVIQFLPFPDEDKQNNRLKNEMEDFPAIGVHIRRGDYQEFLGETNQDYYREAIREVRRIPEYSKAKVYVFSDDIPWCRKNMTGLGLTSDICGEVTFIDHNKGDESFRDMQLLSLCKVIISQQGQFSQVAYLISNRSEMLISPNEDLLALLKKTGRGNKYELSRHNLRSGIEQYIKQWKQWKKNEKESSISPEKKPIFKLETENKKLRQMNRRLQKDCDELKKIKASNGYKLLNKYYKLRDWFLK